jgi:hypothetical protein
MKLLSFSKKNFLIFIFILFHVLIFKNNAQAELIELHNEEKTFGDWKVYCEIDDMMSSAHCKIASKFYDNSSVISLQPTNHFANEFFIIIPKIKIGTFAKIRVDKNDLILSNNASQKEFGLVPINEQQKNTLFSQMKNGEYLFLRLVWGVWRLK